MQLQIYPYFLKKRRIQICISEFYLDYMIGFVRTLLIYKKTSMNPYPHLAFVYFNDANPPFQFRVYEDILLFDLKSKLNTLLRYPENWRVVKLQYCLPLIDNEMEIQFTMFELKSDDDLKVIWSTFYHYSTKGLMNLDATIQRSVKYIIRMLQHSEPLICNDM